MEKPPETLVAVPKRPISEHHRAACMVQIYPTGVGMGSRYTLGDTPVFVGRDNDCQICLDDQSVSRRHARIQPGIDGYYAVDLQSTNGTFVNDRPATMYKLQDGDYVRIGNWIFRYLAGGNVEAEYHEEIYRLTIIDGLRACTTSDSSNSSARAGAPCDTAGRCRSSLRHDFFLKVNTIRPPAGDTLREIARSSSKLFARKNLARHGGRSLHRFADRPRRRRLPMVSAAWFGQAHFATRARHSQLRSAWASSLPGDGTSPPISSAWQTKAHQAKNSGRKWRGLVVDPSSLRAAGVVSAPVRTLHCRNDSLS